MQISFQAEIRSLIRYFRRKANQPQISALRFNSAVLFPMRFLQSIYVQCFPTLWIMLSRLVKTQLNRFGCYNGEMCCCTECSGD